MIKTKTILLLVPLFLATSFGHADEALSAYQQGNIDRAIKLWSNEARQAIAANNHARAVDLLWKKAAAQRSLGQHKAALVSLEKARQLNDKFVKDNKTRGMILASFGDSLSHAGNQEAAVKFLQEAITLSRQADERNTLAIALNNFGNVLTILDNLDSANLAYEEAADIALAEGNHTLHVKALINRVRVLQAQKKQNDAETSLKKAIAQATSVGGLGNKAFLLISLGNLARDQYKTSDNATNNTWLKESFSLLDSADRLARASNDYRNESFAAGYLGKLYIDQGRLEEALVLTDRATRTAQQANAPESEYLWHWQSGRIYKQQGNIDAAISAYRLAVEKIQGIRNELSTRSAFKTVLGPVFFELTDLLLQRPNALSDKQAIEGYLKEARSTMELLKAAELQDYFQDNCVTALQERTSGLDQLQSTTAVLYPIILKDRIEILLSLSGGIERSVSKIDSDELKAKITNFRVLLEKRTTHQYMRYGRQLYDLLIRPMEPVLAKNNIDTLVIVPDAALRTIPMAALHDGKNFLVSKYALATTPGLTLTDPKPLNKDKLKVLVGGLTDAVQGFPALPNVALEVDEINKTYDSTVLMDKKYITKNVESELSQKNFNVVHIASHAQFSSDPEETFLLAYSDKFTMDKLQNLMNQTKFRDDPVELLTLSACQTAAGDERAALGLAGIAIKAGARSALATLWFINDRASSILVSDFYQQLKKENLSKAKALQQAQLSLMKDKRYRHPSYWSPFLLIGNWL